jgi:hypothetical protein
LRVPEVKSQRHERLPWNVSSPASIGRERCSVIGHRHDHALTRTPLSFKIVAIAFAAGE